MHRYVLPVLATLAISAAPGFAMNEFEGPLKDLAAAELAGWMAEPAVIEALRAQNAEHAGLSQADIDGMDTAWRAEVGAAAAPMIEGVMGSPASEVLRTRQEATAGLVTEVFFMDNRGLNVAQSNVTSDYWQGDEAKWQNTYLVGPGGIDISEVEFDESSQTYQSQVSMTVVDPADGRALGAVTFGIDVSLLP